MPTQDPLYQQDFCLWVSDTVAKLKAHEFDELDLEHLIEEIEALGGRDRRELKSRLRFCSIIFSSVATSCLRKTFAVGN